MNLNNTFVIFNQSSNVQIFHSNNRVGWTITLMSWDYFFLIFFFFYFVCTDVEIAIDSSNIQVNKGNHVYIYM
jgi:hypothetical protein